MFTTLQTLSLLMALSGAASAGLVPQQRADICGVKGYDGGRGNYKYYGNGQYNTYAACSDLCVKDSKCKSFGFSSAECMLFNIALNGNFDADSSSPDTYYDQKCIASTPAPVATSSSTASSSTTSSSTTSSSTTSSSTTSKVTTTSTQTTLSSSKQTTTTSFTTNQRVETSTSTSKPPPISSSASKDSSSPTSAALATSASSSSTNAPSSSTPATSTTSSGAPAVSIPAECAGIVAPTLSMTTFSWFNSSHNLDCVRPNYSANDKVCWNSSGAVCANNDPSCTCTPYCYTGIPVAAYQPLGYGPPDTIKIAFSGGAFGCSAANPQSIRRNEIGEGHFDCGSAADYIGFSGDSNKDTGNMGSVYYNAYGSNCNGRVPRYTATFPLTCRRDAGNNATCTAPIPLPLTLASLG